MSDHTEGLVAFSATAIVFSLILIFGVVSIVVKPAWLRYEHEVFTESHQYIESRTTELQSLSSSWTELNTQVEHEQDLEADEFYPTWTKTIAEEVQRKLMGAFCAGHLSFEYTHYMPLTFWNPRDVDRDIALEIFDDIIETYREGGFIVTTSRSDTALTAYFCLTEEEGEGE